VAAAAWGRGVTAAYDLLELVEDGIEAEAVNPHAFRRYTRPQREFLSCSAPIALYRTGNQAGKTYALIDDAIYVCLGTHPFRETPRPPVELMFVSVSDDQMRQPGGLMAKIHEALPRDAIDWERTGWDQARGFTGKPPYIVFRNGSKIGFGSFNQDPQRFAGSSVVGIYADEPSPERTFAELRARVFAKQGFIRLSFTPTPDCPDLTYLRTLVEEGKVAEVHCVTTEENLWAEGALAPRRTQAEIDEFIESYPEYEQAMRREGAWEPLVTGRWLNNFGDHHVRAFDLREIGGTYLTIGIDHGAQAGKQTAVLLAVKDRTNTRPKVWVIDESTGTGATTPEQDAKNILDMLRRNGLTYDNVDEWVGDRSLETRRDYGEKSNALLRREIAALLGRPMLTPPQGTIKWIFTPKKSSGSVSEGIRLLNAVMGRADDLPTGGRVPHFTVHPRCEQLIKACREWAGDRKDPLKDVLDAARYPIERALSQHTLPSAILRRT